MEAGVRSSRVDQQQQRQWLPVKSGGKQSLINGLSKVSSGRTDGPQLLLALY
jgi:hypothetical protein